MSAQNDVEATISAMVIPPLLTDALTKLEKNRCGASAWV
jgi:hypothetical protein